MWFCELCGKKFKIKKEAEIHEKGCNPKWYQRQINLNDALKIIAIPLAFRAVEKIK